ncbi:PQQ-binding-like beta-propeller repeat protein [Streptomyces sp. NPDC047525]|uniref:serine/threonine-protein kinase n=1 Tax=Streptomyces sp. NPDC047525 TaxID=3155264 RepID=UPI0033BFFEC6
MGDVGELRGESSPHPARIGPYRIAGTLGEGGMGAVYLGRDRRGGAAAVKVLRAELARDQGMVRRFRREADAASAVRGRGVAQVLAYDLEGPVPWIAADFLAGPTLREAVAAHGTFTEGGARALGAALARTLAMIHAAGLVHRDIKPSNIVLTRSGPQIIDFGIARPEYGLTLTSPGTAPATPGFAPPEQVTGRRAGPAADVFALGAVLALACTGQAPFGGGHPAGVNFRVVHEDPDLDGLPDALLAVVRGCLEKDPGARPAPERVAELLRARGGGERPWRRAPLRTEIERRARTAAARLAEAAAAESGADQGQHPSRRALLAAFGTAVVAAGGGGLAWWLLRDDGTEGPRTTAGGVPFAAPVARPTAGTVPSALWRARGVDPDGPGPLAVDRVVVAPLGPGLAAWTQHTGERAWTWPGNGAPAQGGPLLFQEAGRAVIAVTRGGWVTALDARTGRKLWDARAADARQALAVDSRHVYVLDGDRHVRALALADHRVGWTSKAAVGADGPPSAAVAGGRLLVTTRDARAVALDTASGEVSWEKDLGPVKSFAVPVGLPPAVLGDGFCVGGDRMVALRARDGSERWSHDADGPLTRWTWGAPTVVDDVVYAPRRQLFEGEILCLDAADGSSRWTAKVGYAGGGLTDAVLPLRPAVRQGHALYVPLGAEPKSGSATRTHDRGVVTLDTRSGRKLWAFNDDAEQAGWGLAGAAGRVFVARGGELRAMPSL